MSDPLATTNIPTDSVPDELKSSCEQILKRGKELRKVDPVMSYWCCFAAANLAMNIQGRTQAGTTFLVKLLDVLEEMKQALVDSPSIETSTITDESAGSAYVENFAMKVFLQADDEDREGRAEKATIRKFVVAAQFIEVLRCFEPPYGMREEMDQKLRYARWKAAEIAKALKEGRRPVPGPPGGETPNPLDEIITPPFPGFAPIPNTDVLPSAPTSSLSPPPSSLKPRRGSGGSATSPGGGNGGGLTLPLPIEGSESVVDSENSGQWSTVATPGLPGEEEETFGLPVVPPTEPGGGGVAFGSGGNGNGNGGRRDSLSAKKNVRFAGPDGAPLSPAGTYATLDSYVAPGGPPPSELGTEDVDMEGNGKAKSSLLGNGLGLGGTEGGSRGNSPSLPPQGNKGLPSVPSGFGSNANASGPSAPPGTTNNSYPTPTAPPPVPSPQPPLGPTSPAITPASSTLRSSAPSAPSFPSTTKPTAPPPPPAAPAPSPTPQLDSKGIERCQKHARWAISALDYEDYETARGELRKALAMLGG